MNLYELKRADILLIKGTNTIGYFKDERTMTPETYIKQAYYGEDPLESYIYFMDSKEEVLEDVCREVIGEGYVVDSYHDVNIAVEMTMYLAGKSKK